MIFNKLFLIIIILQFIVFNSNAQTQAVFEVNNISKVKKIADSVEYEVTLLLKNRDFYYLELRCGTKEGLGDLFSMDLHKDSISTNEQYLSAYGKRFKIENDKVTISAITPLVKMRKKYFVVVARDKTGNEIQKISGKK